MLLRRTDYKNATSSHIEFYYSRSHKKDDICDFVKKYLKNINNRVSTSRRGKPVKVHRMNDKNIDFNLELFCNQQLVAFIVAVSYLNNVLVSTKIFL